MEKIREKHLCKEDTQDKKINCREEEIEDLSTEDFLEMIGEGLESETDEEILPAIALDLSNIFDCQINKEEFQKGLDRGSEVLGFITALKQGGLDSTLALSLLLNESTIQHNLEMGNINKETSISVAEKQSVLVEKQQL